MGTETYRLVFLLLVNSFFIVKLNNPLMGTETNIKYFNIIIFYEFLLN